MRAQDKGITVLVAVIGLIAIVPFKLMVCANRQHRHARASHPPVCVQYNDGEILKRGETMGIVWWIGPVIWTAAFFLVFADVIVAAEGSPIASNVYFCASMMLGYFIWPSLLLVRGATATSISSSPFTKYTPGIKALVYFGLDMLFFGFLVYGTAFAAIGHPFRDLDMFLVPSTHSPTAAPTAA